MSPLDDRFARHPDLARLHDDLTQPVTTEDVDTNEDVRSVSDMLVPLIDTSMFSPTVQRYVNELLLGGENPNPSTRQRLVNAADRGLRTRRDQRSVLPVLLASTREQKRIEVSTIADALGVSAQQVYELESGKANLRTLGAEMIASWIRAMHVDSTTAIEALRQALLRSTSSRSPQAAARGRGKHISDSDQQLIADVAARLAPNE